LYVLAIAVSSGLNQSTMTYISFQHLSIDVYRAIYAFVDSADIPHGAIVFNRKLNDPTQVAKSAVYSVQTLLADSFFVSSVLSLVTLWRVV
jgi:hypothetical protein